VHVNGARLARQSLQQTRNLHRIPAIAARWRWDTALVECLTRPLRLLMPAARNSTMIGARSAALAAARSRRSLRAARRAAGENGAAGEFPDNPIPSYGRTPAREDFSKPPRAGRRAPREVKSPELVGNIMPSRLFRGDAVSLTPPIVSTPVRPARGTSDHCPLALGHGAR
jgi:hypothetical protein